MSFVRTRGRRRRTSRILGVSHGALNRWLTRKMQIKLPLKPAHEGNNLKAFRMVYAIHSNHR